MQISLYVIITVLVIYSLSLVLKNFSDVIDYVGIKLSWVIDVLQPIILGFVFAYLMDPLVNFFEDKYRKLKNVKPFRRIRSTRTLAAITAVLIFVIAIVGLISLLAYTVTNQLKVANFDDLIKFTQDSINNVNKLYGTIQAKLSDLNIQSKELDNYIKDATGIILSTIQGFANGILRSITNISGYMTTFIFSFIIGIYFMIDGRMFANFFVKICRALLNDKANKRLFNVARDLDEVFSGYIRGQMTDAFVMMILISISLYIVGVDYAILIGVFAGIGNLIPYFGPIVAYVSTTIVCLVNGDFRKLIVALIVLFVIQALDGNLIGPKLLSNAIKVHPLIVMISIIIGGSIGGFLGMLVAVPIGAYCKMVLVRFINRQLEHKQATERTDIITKK